MAKYYPVSIFLTIGSSLISSQSSLTSENIQKFKEYLDGIYYLSLIGSLLYVMQIWLNIQFVVG